MLKWDGRLGRALWRRPRHWDRGPDGSLICAQSPDYLLLFLAALSALWVAEGMATQTEERAQEKRPAAFGPILNICNKGWVGHSTVLQDTQGPSCL